MNVPLGEAVLSIEILRVKRVRPAEKSMRYRVALRLLDVELHSMPFESRPEAIRAGEALKRGFEAIGFTMQDDPIM